MSITNRLRNTAWLSTRLLGTACAYAFVQADYPGHPSVKLPRFGGRPGHKHDAPPSPKAL